MKYEVSKTKWEKCNICGLSIGEIKKQIGGTNVYFSEAFIAHLKREHGVEPSDYFEKISLRPVCSCGKCGQKTDISRKGAKIYWKEFKCGRNQGVIRWSEEARTVRRGTGNPMFGKDAWNKGIRPEQDKRVAKMAEVLKRYVFTDEDKKKMSDSAKKRIIHGHTGIRHTEESKRIMAEATAKRHAEGKFSHTNTLPHCLMCDILDEMGLEYRSEVIDGIFSFDLLVEEKFYIEVDGDFFHSNPRFYPDGPVSKIQKRNRYNDYRKNKYCEESGKILLRFWEYDIKNLRKEVKEKILCTVKELFQ